MRNIRISTRFFAATVLVGLTSVSTTTFAASQCKGMQEQACLAKAECSWIQGYVRKDGRSVGSHCKAKARRKPANQAALGTLKTGRSNQP